MFITHFDKSKLAGNLRQHDRLALFVGLIVAGIWTTILINDPFQAEYDHWKGMRYLKSGEFDKAMTFFDRAFKKDPEEFEGWISQRPLLESLIINKDGIDALHAGKLSEALESFEQVLEMTPESAVVLHSKGAVLMRKNRLRDALEVFEKAIELDPEYYDAYQDRAVVFRLMGRYEDSIEACRKILEDISPDHPKTICSMAWAYEEAGQYHEAVKTYVRAIMLSPNWEFPKQKLLACLDKMSDLTASVESIRVLKDVDNELWRKIENKFLK